jgi:hypothetical protein
MKEHLRNEQPCYAMTWASWPPCGLPPDLILSAGNKEAGGKQANQPSTKPASHTETIACQQVLLDDSSVFSIHWLVLTGFLWPLPSPMLLTSRYLLYIRRSTHALVRPVVDEKGFHFRVSGFPFVLLRFDGPVIQCNERGQSATFSLSGGLMSRVQSGQRCTLVFACQKITQGIKVTVQLSGYCPLLIGKRNPPSRFRIWLYRQIQAKPHKKLTIAFLHSLSHELTGRQTVFKILPVKIKNGREI